MNASSITTHDIVKKLSERGHEITLLAPRRCPKECFHDCSLACDKDPKIAVIRVPTFVPYHIIKRNSNIRALTLALCQLLLALKALKIGSEKQVDVVVSQHHPSHLASLSAFLSSRILNLPLIVKTHDVYDSSSGVLPFFFLHILDSIYRKVLKRADRILVVSGPLRSRIIETHKLEEKKVVVFPNGVDTKIFNPDVAFASLQRGLQVEGKKVILFIGRIREERGLQILIKALPRIVAKNPAVRVLIVGDGPQKPRVKNLVQELMMQRFVKFIRSVNHSEIPRYICLADVAVGPLVANIDTLGSVPRKVLEYMACAKPVVTSYGGVSSDLVINEYNGFLVHPENLGELASVFLKAIESPDLIEEVGLNARKHVERFYDWNKIIDQMEEVLHSVFARD